MALNQYIRIEDLQPMDVGFFYEGIPEAGVTLGVFTYRFDGNIYVNQCTLNCDAGQVGDAPLLLTLNDVVIAYGTYYSALIGSYSTPYVDDDPIVPVVAGDTVRLLNANPSDEERSNIRSTIAAYRAARVGSV